MGFLDIWKKCYKYKSQITAECFLSLKDEYRFCLKLFTCVIVSTLFALNDFSLKLFTTENGYYENQLQLSVVVTRQTSCNYNSSSKDVLFDTKQQIHCEEPY